MSNKSKTECILHEGPYHENGYGVISVNGKQWLAHRWAAHIAYGDISGMVVRHKCDNRGCVNPEHLIVGDQKQNMHDRITRSPRSTKCKLWPYQVLEIRRLLSEGKTPRQIAPMYGIAAVTVRAIRAKITWRNI